MEKYCPICFGLGWVCENHPHKPWEGERACNCGGDGAPCSWCNQNDAEPPPRMPDGFDQKGEPSAQTETLRSAGALTNLLYWPLIAACLHTG